MSRPADRNNTQDSCDDEDNAPGQADVGLGPSFIAVEVGAAGADHGQSDGHHADGDGDADQGPGGLQLLWQRQNRVVGLALRVTCALKHAVHPQTLPEDLSRDDVRANKGRHLPHGQRADEDGAEEAQDGQTHADQLSLHSADKSDP